MTIKHSAAELEKASNVAFIVSEPIYRKIKHKKFITYDSLLLNGIDSWIDVVLSHERYPNK